MPVGSSYSTTPTSRNRSSPSLPHNPQGHILRTSRAQVFDTLGIAKLIEIEEMLPEEALEFLFKRTGRDDDNPEERDAAAQIANELGYLPLALEQAGAYITKMKSSFQDYLVSYRKPGLELLEKTRTVTGEYPKSIATTWSLNFEQVERACTAAADLLRFSARVSPDKIALELITLGAVELGPTLSAALTNVDTDPVVLYEVLEPLTQYSLIRRDLESRTFDIHRRVQAVLKDKMDEATQRQWAERTVRAVDRAFPGFEFSDWPLCEQLLPHAQACAELIEKWSLEFEESAVLLNQVGSYLYERARFNETEPLLPRSLAILEKVLRPDHPDAAYSLLALVEVYRAQGRYAEAEPCCQRALMVWENSLGSEHSNVAACLENYAALLRQTNREAEAAKLEARARTIRAKHAQENSKK